MALRRRSIMAGPSSMTSHYAASKFLMVARAVAMEAPQVVAHVPRVAPLPASAPASTDDGDARPGSVLCPNCGASNVVPEEKLSSTALPRSLKWWPNPTYPKRPGCSLLNCSRSSSASQL